MNILAVSYTHLIGIITNAEELSKELLEKGCANFETMSSGNINSGGLIGALIAQKDSFVEGIKYAQEKIKGTMSLVIMTEDSIICARDMMGRLPIIIGKRSDGYCFSFESFAFQKLGYSTCHELKAGEIVKLTKDCLLYTSQYLSTFTRLGVFVGNVMIAFIVTYIFEML